MSPGAGATQGAAHRSRVRATPTSPGCRSTTSSTPVTCSSGHRPARRRRGSRPARVAKALLAEPRRRGHLPRRSRSARVAAVAAVRPDARRSRRGRRVAGALLRPAAEEAMIAEIKAAAKDGDSLGGVVEVLGLRRAGRARQPRALGPQARRAARAGAHEHPGGEGRRDRRRVRGRRPARERRPTIRSAGTPRPAPTAARRTLAGGIEGGMSTGELLVVRAAMKPLATLNRPTLETVDTVTKESRRCRSRNAPMSPRCRPWVSWPRRWWRSCSPARRCASSAATRSASSCATTSSFSSRFAMRPSRAERGRVTSDGDVVDERRSTGRDRGVRRRRADLDDPSAATSPCAGPRAPGYVCSSA